MNEYMSNKKCQGCPFRCPLFRQIYVQSMWIEDDFRPVGSKKTITALGN